MTPREQALLLRLAAAEITREAQSAFVIRDELRRLGWTEHAMDAGVTRVRAAVWRQTSMWERAA